MLTDALFKIVGKRGTLVKGLGAADTFESENFIGRSDDIPGHNTDNPYLVHAFFEVTRSTSGDLKDLVEVTLDASEREPEPPPQRSQRSVGPSRRHLQRRGRPRAGARSHALKFRDRARVALGYVRLCDRPVARGSGRRRRRATEPPGRP